MDFNSFKCSTYDYYGNVIDLFMLELLRSGVCLKKYNCVMV